MFGLILLIDQEEVILQVRQGVWLEVGEVCDIVLNFKLIAERQGVQSDHLRSLVLILVARDVLFVEFVIGGTLPDFGPEFVFVVADIIAASLPKVGACLFVLLNGVYEGLHADLIARFVLLQIHDVELVLAALADVSHREEEPLRVVGRVIIKIYEAVVLEFIKFLNLSEVAGLKSRVEEDGGLLDVVRWEHDRVLGQVF